MKYHQNDRRRNHHQTAFHPLGSNELCNCQVYVIELDVSVTSEPSFMARNPKYRQGSPCYYVGMTSLIPEDRYLEHVQGTKNVSHICHQYGRNLRMDLVPSRKPTRRTWAMMMEERLAKDLRARGFGAWKG